MIPRLTVLFIFVFGIQEICSSQNFSGQVFLLSKEFIEDKCEVNAGCDCCGTDLFFLSKTKFGFVSRCLSGDTYFTGTYSLKAKYSKIEF
jgi:hypothetical protein